MGKGAICVRNAVVKSLGMCLSSNPMKSLTLEQAILEKVRLLPPEQQQEVLDFAEFLAHKRQLTSATSPEVDSEDSPAPQPSPPEPTAYVPKTPLGKRLWEPAAASDRRRYEAAHPGGNRTGNCGTTGQTSRLV